LPYICSPLAGVVSQKGNKALVINLKHLNQNLWKEHFKYEGLCTVMQMISKHDYVFTFDLKSGYHHVDIYLDHWQYLSFAWEVKGHHKYYTFIVLSFSLATACYVFAKLMRSLIWYWHGNSIRTVVYIDKGIVAVKSNREAQIVSLRVQEDLKKAGFVINVEKSNWVPLKNYHLGWF